MRAVDIIIKKRDGHALTAEEIVFFVRGIVSGEIADYQAAAWLMAVYHHSLDFDELAALTNAMIQSGEQFDLSPITGPKIDKHSTGGVGDKVSLILAPLVACAGVRVPQVAGRGLGHTGGTLDKLESVPGFRTRLSGEEFVRVVRDVGCAIIGQTERFVPADKILYSLRDVTGTVESVPLIAASIMSKKVASGADAFIMDVKTGSGAFMESEERTRELALTLTRLGALLGKKVVCLITDMNQPLGEWIGNAAEVVESVSVLKGTGDVALTQLCLTLGAWMLKLAGIEENLASGREILAKKITSGEAARKFAQMIEAQGGDPSVVDNPALLKIAGKRAHFGSPQTGFVAAYNTHAIGMASVILGAGREKVTDEIDPSVAVLVHKKIGDRATRDEPLFTLCYNDDTKLKAALEALEGCARISDTPVEPPALVKETVVPN